MHATKPNRTAHAKQGIQSVQRYLRQRLSRTKRHWAQVAHRRATSSPAPEPRASETEATDMDQPVILQDTPIGHKEGEDKENLEPPPGFPHRHHFDDAAASNAMTISTPVLVAHYHHPLPLREISAGASGHQEECQDQQVDYDVKAVCSYHRPEPVVSEPYLAENAWYTIEILERGCLPVFRVQRHYERAAPSLRPEPVIVRAIGMYGYSCSYCDDPYDERDRHRCCPHIWAVVSFILAGMNKLLNPSPPTSETTNDSGPTSGGPKPKADRASV
jgi:hypothetical protein